MNTEHLITFATGFIFGTGFVYFIDLVSELYIYFYHKNKDYREKKQEKKSM